MVCGCLPQSFRKEFQWRKCGLSCARPSCFYCSQFKIPESVFILYKAVLAAYTLIWLIINIVEAPGAETNNGQSSFVFLTTWTYILLNLHLYVSLFDAIFMTWKHTKDGDIHSVADPLGFPCKDTPNNQTQISTLEGGVVVEPTKKEHVYGMTWYHKIVWVIHDMISGAAPVVTLVYFAFLYPLAQEDNPEFASSWLDVNIHGINTVIMIIDNFVSAIPIRLLHVIYPVIYGVIYVIFSIVYYFFDPDNNILYPDLLDWSHPETTIPTIVIVVAILMPLVQLLWYLWYRLRLWLFWKIYHLVFCDPTKL